MLTRGVVTSPCRIADVRPGPWAPITVPPVLELGDGEVVVSCPQVTVRVAYTPPPGFAPLPVGRWGSVERTLDGVPGHKDAGPGLRRFAFADAPVHASLHQVLDVVQLVPDYCVVHTHEDAAELNVLIPGSEPLEFELYLDGPLIGRAPMCLWIPPGAGHCAMARAGTGFLFVLRVPLDQGGAAGSRGD